MNTIQTRYLNLIKSALTDTLGKFTLSTNDGTNVVLNNLLPDHPRWIGNDWPFLAHTMVGMKRLDQFQKAIEHVVANNIPGGIVECGTWRGGCAILAAAVLDVLGVRDRTIWVCDSFSGVPAPECVQDAAMVLHNYSHYLGVSMDDVKAAFKRFGVNDDPVLYHAGMFKDSLPGLKGGTWSVIRADGEMYSSTMDILTNLYHGLSAGGIIVIDDYFHIQACRQAVDEFRDIRGITAEIQTIDTQGCFWIKLPGEPCPASAPEITLDNIAGSDIVTSD